MSEEVYFNEPGYEHEIGQPEGEKKNEAYANIVRFCNMKYAMLGQIKKPSKGFETVIRRHFYLKREEIMEEVKDWIELSEKKEASYTGLVQMHNADWCTKFSKDTDEYKIELKKLATEIEEAMKAIKPADLQDEITSKAASNDVDDDELVKEKQRKKAEKKKLEEANKQLEEIDEDDGQNDEEVDTKTMDIEDEEVKDRWSRYIGAMGIEAVAKQASTRIYLDNLSPVGMEIAKNLVLAGCKELIINDTKFPTWEDLSGNFFLNEDSVSEDSEYDNRAQVCKKKLQQLNYYVKVTIESRTYETILDKDSPIHGCNIVILTNETNRDNQIKLNNFCREKGIKFIMADCYGVFARVFNDFGDEFEILDKDGEELLEVMIDNITNEEEGLVTLLDGFKHNLEDGDEVVIREVKGMQLSSDPTKSINETIHKVLTKTPSTFTIGDTTCFSEYEGSGLAKPLKTKKMMKFIPLEKLDMKEPPFDPNLMIADFEKMEHYTWSEILWNGLHTISSVQKKTPKPWNLDYLNGFYDAVFEDMEKLLDDIGDADEKKKKRSQMLDYFVKFICSHSGSFPPLCAFIGGLVAQEAIKAITQKFCPVNQILHYNVLEVMSGINGEEFKEDPDKFDDFTNIEENRYKGLSICLGKKLVELIHNSRVFMVGAGAIGCELLKNYSMLGSGSGPDGSITLTDPDVIEVSNLNRQFLFRERHLRKAKSLTAAAAAIRMNRDLRMHIDARLDKIFKGTESSYDDAFYQGLTILTNALDNVQARRYLDIRTVKNRVPMIDSGTLGPKGHVQIVLPD